MTYNPISQAEVLRQIKIATDFLNEDTFDLALPINQSKYKDTLHSCNEAFIEPVKKHLMELEGIKRNILITIGNYTVMTNNSKIRKNSLNPIINSFLKACEILIITNKFDDSMLNKINAIVQAILNLFRESQDKTSIDSEVFCLVIKTVDIIEPEKKNNPIKMQFIEALLDKNNSQ